MIEEMDEEDNHNKKQPVQRTQAPGGGRKKKTTTCKDLYICPVCRTEKRKDNLESHYKSKVLFIRGKPAPTFFEKYMRCTSNDKKSHTKYFIEHGLDENKLPPLKLAGAPLNPFFAAKEAKRQKSEAIAEEVEDVTMVENESAQADEELTEMEEQISDECDTSIVQHSESDSEDKEETGGREEKGEDDEDMEGGGGNSSTDRRLDDERVGGGKTEAEVTAGMIEGHRGLRLSGTDCFNIASQVANILFKKEKLKEEEEEETAFRKLINLLTETDKNFICMPCVTYSHTDKIPKKLRGNARGNYGTFHKFDGDRKVNKTRRENVKSHFQNPLHDLCMKLKKEDEEQRLADEKKNVMACTKVITNAIYCLKYSKSSTDFVRLNDKDNLTTSIRATINDGPQQFFYYREEIYDKFSGIVKAAFAQVKSAAFTLDKVTVE